jgi:hypothetical protein
VPCWYCARPKSRNDCGPATLAVEQLPEPVDQLCRAQTQKGWRSSLRERPLRVAGLIPLGAASF